MDNFDDSFEITNAEDHEILMHREAHFGGSFGAMLEYYRQEGKGVAAEIDITRIKELEELEKRQDNNLAAEILSGADAEQIKEIRDVYKSLRELYEEEKPKNILPVLIADLILSEEENPEEEIHAIVQQKGTIVPLLIDLIRSEKFYNPLFPGYGQAPALAVQCLGKIGDKKALYSLFEMIGETNLFSEEGLLDAIKQIGPSAKEFLLKVVQSNPINIDNERAAIALAHFSDDPEICSTCLKLLQNPEVWKHPVLSLHLILACEDLQGPIERKQFAELVNQAGFPKMLVQDVKAVVKQFDL